MLGKRLKWIVFMAKIHIFYLDDKPSRGALVLNHQSSIDQSAPQRGSSPIAIVVNAVRVSLTGVLAHNFGRETATGFIHDFQGMITFGMAFFMLLLLARSLSFGANFFTRKNAQESSPA